MECDTATRYKPASRQLAGELEYSVDDDVHRDITTSDKMCLSGRAEVEVDSERPTSATSV